MRNLLLAGPAVILIGLGTAALGQDAPAGASATGCDTAQFTAIRSERTGEILYWNNRSCPAGSGPAGSAAPAPDPEDSCQPYNPKEKSSYRNGRNREGSYGRGSRGRGGNSDRGRGGMSDR